MKNIFLDHPRTNNESYIQHFYFAIKCGSLMILSGCACIVHAFLPFIFQDTASSSISYLATALASRQISNIKTN